ncbi:MAG: Methylamine utilization protein, partial [Ignavibacteria bacterium]
GVSKIIDTTSLIEVLQQIKLPVDLVIITATLLPLTEIGLGLMLILKLQQQTALRITVLLFLVFFLFAVYGTAIGINEDCGCYGKIIKSEFDWMMIVRNAVLLTISIIVTKKIENKCPGAGQKQTNKPIK